MMLSTSRISKLIHIKHTACFQRQLEIFLSVVFFLASYKNLFNKFCVQSFRNTLKGEPSTLIDRFEQQRHVSLITLVSVD